MSIRKVGFKPLIFAFLGSLVASTAQALPALQLGGGGTGWGYNTATQTWVYIGDGPATFSAYANDDGTGANGAYAWDSEGASDQYAYLTVAAVPQSPASPVPFNISVTGGSKVADGFGSPPLEDDNSLASHGIFDTYFEIFEFKFDGPIIDIGDTQPGQSGTGKGYKEDFSITLTSLATGVDGLHFDLFTVQGDGKYSSGIDDDKKLVKAFAPFSHDAEWTPWDPTDPDPDPRIPTPGTILLFGLGLVGVKLARKRRR